MGWQTVALDEARDDAGRAPWPNAPTNENFGEGKITARIMLKLAC